MTNDMELFGGGKGTALFTALHRHNALNVEKERMRQRLNGLADKAIDTFEDIMLNSDDDKARNVAASKTLDLWAMSNELSAKVDVTGMNEGPTSTNIQINVNSLRDVLNSAARGMNGKGMMTDHKIELLEMVEEIDDAFRTPDTDEDVPLVNVKPTKISGLLRK